MVLVYEVDGLDGVDKSKGTSGFNGHQRIKGYNGQRDWGINWAQTMSKAKQGCKFICNEMV